LERCGETSIREPCVKALGSIFTTRPNRGTKEKRPNFGGKKKKKKKQETKSNTQTWAKTIMVRCNGGTSLGGKGEGCPGVLVRLTRNKQSTPIKSKSTVAELRG